MIPDRSPVYRAIVKRSRQDEYADWILAGYERAHGWMDTWDKATLYACAREMGVLQ